MPASYPNGRGPMYNDGKLLKGQLFSTVTENSSGLPTSLANAIETVSSWFPGSRQFNTTVKKERFVEFQFNPPQLELQVQHQPTDNGDSVVELDPWQAHVSPGLATSKLELLFERSMEVYRGDEGYATLGVAKDILDVYSVINGGDVKDGPTSVGALTLGFTDLVTNGSELAQTGTVAVQFSPDLVLYGIVMGWNFTFVKFNRNLVPTMGKVFMNLTVMNATDRTRARSLSSGYGPGGEDDGTSGDGAWGSGIDAAQDALDRVIDQRGGP